LKTLAADSHGHKLVVADFATGKNFIIVIVCQMCGAYAVSNPHNLTSPCPAHFAESQNRGARYAWQQICNGRHPKKSGVQLNGVIPLDQLMLSLAEEQEREAEEGQEQEG
jgi:hypothetical protein